MSQLYLYPAIFNKFPELVAAQSTRHGGNSSAPYQGLNLGWGTKDDPENIKKNRDYFFSSLGISEKLIASSLQVHDAEILVTEEPGRNSGFDALITASSNIFLTVTIADCCPVLIYDPRNKVVAAVHAGWRGSVKKICEKTLEKMNSAYGTHAKECCAFIGACISEKHFEVDVEVAIHFSPDVCRWDEQRNKFLVNLKMENERQLLSQGLLKENIEISSYCTVENNDRFFSYRKEGKESGRMLAVIGMK